MKRFVMLTALALAGCSDAPATKTWLGKSEGSLYASHGTPSRESKLGDGSKSVAFPIRNVYGQVICERNFIVSASGQVTRASTTCL